MASNSESCNNPDKISELELKCNLKGESKSNFGKLKSKIFGMKENCFRDDNFILNFTIVYKFESSSDNYYFTIKLGKLKESITNTLQFNINTLLIVFENNHMTLNKEVLSESNTLIMPQLNDNKIDEDWLDNSRKLIYYILLKYISSFVEGKDNFVLEVY